MKQTGLKNIALKTGFSTTRASRVLNGKSNIFRISPATTALILKVTKESGYEPIELPHIVELTAERVHSVTELSTKRSLLFRWLLYFN